MGYRLETSAVKPADCGGKLYGYISKKDLHKLKSWKWLVENEWVSKADKDKWDYGYDHQMVMWHEDFEEFIKLYIEDYNTYYGEKVLSLKDFKASLKAEMVLVEWF